MPSLAFAAAITLSATSSYAADSSQEVYDNVTVTAPISANGAKRIARRFLNERGFAYGIGPGAARVKSISRDGDTWVLKVAYSNGGVVMNNYATLYVEANSTTISETAPTKKQVQVAAGFRSAISLAA